MSDTNEPSNWSTTFPVTINCQKQSYRLMKKILALSVSYIASVRFNFPDEAFVDVDFDDMKLKLLAKSDFQPGLQLIDWMKAAMSALDQGYLKEIDLIVYKDETKEEIVELYKFNLENHGPGPDGDGDVQPDGDEPISRKDHVYKETQNLFRMMNNAMMIMPKFPETSTLSMKSVFYSHTPKNYKMKGYGLSSPVREPSKCLDPINFGKIKTPWHKLDSQIIQLSKNEADADPSVETMRTPSHGGARVRFSLDNNPQEQEQASIQPRSNSKAATGRPKPTFFGDQTPTASETSEAFEAQQVEPKRDNGQSQASDKPPTKRRRKMDPIPRNRLDEFSSNKRTKI